MRTETGCTRRSFLASLFGGAALSGCAVIVPRAIVTTNHAQHLLQPLQREQSAIDLEIAFVQRAVGDPLLRTSLWSQVNQVSSQDHEQRAKLAGYGVQYGIASSTPSFALQTLLSADSTAPGRWTQRYRYSLPSGGENILETGVLAPLTEMAVPTPTGSRVKRFDSARCVMRVQARSIEDGWARLDFLPEIHHGPSINRRVATDAGWAFQQSQEIEALYDLRFEMELNLGEHAVVGLQDSDKETLGHRFFRGSKAGKLEGVMIVKLHDIHTVTGVHESVASPFE